MNPIRWKYSWASVLLVVLAMAGCSTAPHRMTASTWPDKIENAYGGRAAYDALRYLRFDFVVTNAVGAEQGRFRHLWDTETDDYRFECPSAAFANSGFLNTKTNRWESVGLNLPEGDLVALVNLRTGAGGVYVNGKLQTNPDLVEYAIQRIQNDIFWLLLPFKLQPPYARIEDLGMGATPDAEAAHMLRVTFAPGQGVTPKDVYTLYLDPHTNRILRDEIALQNTDRVVKADWKGSKKVGLLDLATHRVFEGGRQLVFDPLEALWVLPDKVFTDPGAKMPQ